MSVLRHRFSNERWGGGRGGGAEPPFRSYSVKVCTCTHSFTKEIYRASVFSQYLNQNFHCKKYHSAMTRKPGLNLFILINDCLCTVVCYAVANLEEVH